MGEIADCSEWNQSEHHHDNHNNHCQQQNNSQAEVRLKALKEAEGIGFPKLESYIEVLVKNLRLDNLEATFLEIDSLSSALVTPTSHAPISVRILFSSHILSRLLQSEDKDKIKEVWIIALKHCLEQRQVLVDSVEFDSFLWLTLCHPTFGSKVEHQQLVDYFISNNSLSFSTAARFALAIAVLRNSQWISCKVDIVIQFLIGELQTLVETGFLSNESSSDLLIVLGRAAVFELLTNYSCTNNQKQYNQVHHLFTEFVKMNDSPSVVSPTIVGTDTSGSEVINILMDLGPACTSNASTFRDALRIVTQKLPSVGGDLNPNYSPLLKEGTIARLIHFFSAIGSSPTANQWSLNDENSSLSAAFVHVYTNDYDWKNTMTTSGGGEWNLEVVSQVLSNDFTHLDWNLVSRSFDFPEFKVRDARHMELLIALCRSGGLRQIGLPLDTITVEWNNRLGQLTLLENLLLMPQRVYGFVVDDEEEKDALPVEGVATNCLNPRGWASSKVLQRLLHLSDDKSLLQKVREVFVVGLSSCPEIILCALVRLQLSVASAAAINEEAKANACAGMAMKGELMRELIPLFFKPITQHVVRNAPGALRRLWEISQNTVLAACVEAWRSTSNESSQTRYNTIVHIIGVVRILPSPEIGVAALLNCNKDPEFSFTVAFVMADNDMLQLQPWLVDKVEKAGANRSILVASLILYLEKYSAQVAPRRTKPLISIENLATSLQLLVSLDNDTLSCIMPGASADPSTGKVASLGSSIKALVESCVHEHPNLSSSISVQPAIDTSSNNHVAMTQDDIEEMANSYFQKVYTSEQSAREVVEMLKRFKTSGSSRENDIFACMIHNLFDEYRFFSKYPEKELRITGILFGLLIKEQLVSSITLGIALRYVLEALRKSPSLSPQSGKMFRFGMFALEQFKERLHEWPQYCSHIVQIPHLRESYAQLVAEIDGEMGDTHSQASASTGPNAPTNESYGKAVDSNDNGPSNHLSNSIMLGGEITIPRAQMPIPSVSSLMTGAESGNICPSVSSGAVAIGRSINGTVPSRIEGSTPAFSLKEQKQRKAVFGPGLGRAVNAPSDSNDTHNETPPETLLDSVQCLMNNLAMSNVEQKSQDLRDMLDAKYFGWLGHYLVVKRISTQPNFHLLYLSFLDNLGDYGKGLIEAILSSVYVNVGKLLRSQKIQTSTSERSLLKNLGSWLGQITLARNRPILQIMLDCKELLYQGYETGMLIAVTPFVAKILEGAKSSTVFSPPNPWLMGILSVFRALYNVDDLKMNIKFEVEVLCKNLGLKLEEIPMINADLSKRISPVKEKNPDFNLKSQQSGVLVESKSMPSKLGPGQSTLPPGQSMLSVSDGSSTVALTGEDASKSDAASDSGSQDQQQTVIPNLATYVNVNPNLTQLFSPIQGSSLALHVPAEVLKRLVPIAVDRAIREIIQPVVERSVSIASITTKAIVTKDFAMESDDNKMRKAAQLMVANLSGSLALVTCRDPLHKSISSHLRQLLMTVINNASGRISEMTQLNDIEQHAFDQCIDICSSDNLELGCMLIEKAAMEKAVREVDEALSPALSLRKKHREQTGQPYYDLSIFHHEGQRYPKCLPESLRPKVGGLRPELLLVYDAFQKVSRLPASSTHTDGQVLSEVDENAAEQLGEEPVVVPTGQVNLNAVSAIAVKLNSLITALLNTAGHRAQEINLAMIPPDHEIKELLSAVPHVLTPSDDSRPLRSTEIDAVLSFSQGIFKRLYEIKLSERLRMEVMVVLLKMLNKICPQLGRDMATWVTYAPTNNDVERNVHRTVLLLLGRSELIPIENLDAYLSKNADEGRDPAWLEFVYLFVRTAAVESIAPPSKMPKMIRIIKNVAEDKANVNSEVKQAFRKAALRLLEELRINLDLSDSKTKLFEDTKRESGPTQLTYEESSSLSLASLKHLTDAPFVISKASQSFACNDPPNAKQLVTEILVNWLRCQSDASSNDKIFAHFLQRLQQQFGVGSNDIQTERFLRLATEIVIESSAKSVSTGDQIKTLNYSAIDGHAKLLSYLVRCMNSGGLAEQVSIQRIAFLNKVLGVVTRSLVTHFEKSEREPHLIWDQRPWFRLLLNMVYELYLPGPSLDPIKSAIVNIFGSAFHVIQPLVVPGFSFAWLELVSHRMFLSNLLLLKDQKGWGVMHQLMIDLLLFLEPHLRKVELSEATKKYYDGALRVILLLVHDFPTFLAAHHLSFCNIIPENCIQLRNLVLSAIPKGIPLHDPISRSFKIDHLPEISKSPLILSNVVGPLISLKIDLDGYLQNKQPAEFLTKLIPLLLQDGKSELDIPKINSLVLYVGMQGLARLQNDQIASSLGHTPEMEVFQKLMQLNHHGRYISLNAIANQLRYPSSHTHYFSCVMLFLFNETKDECVKEQVTRVLLERLITQRPHPWGLLITFIELIKNQKYQFWSQPFTRCASEIENVFENVARSCMLPNGVRITSGDGDPS